VVLRVLGGGAIPAVAFAVERDGRAVRCGALSVSPPRRANLAFTFVWARIQLCLRGRLFRAVE